MDSLNVEYVYKASLCCSCGLCVGVCSQKSISYQIDKFGFLKPIIDYNTCNSCGACYNLCPGIKELKSKNNTEETYCYGHSADNETRIQASSGGIATELLCYMLNNKTVDYVTVVTNRTNKQLPKIILTNDINVVKECKASKYCPVPFGEIINEIKLAKGNVAILGLPCQINALKKLRIPNIKYCLSLFCNHVPSYSATNYLAVGIKMNDWSLVKYRGNGWPGEVQFVSENQKIAKNIEYRKAVATGFGIYFKNRRCFICNDPFAKSADIVFGDAYFLEQDNLGSSFCIVRNEDIKTYLSEMDKHGRVAMTNGPDIAIIKKYFQVLFKRETDYSKKIQMLKVLRLHTPEYNLAEKKAYTVKELVRFKIDLMKINLGKNRFLWKYLFKKNKGLELKIRLEKI